jgi:hypothetical protein
MASSSAYASTIPAPPPSTRPGPGVRRCSSFPTPWGDCYDRASAEELKLAAMARFPLTGLGKRACAREFGLERRKRCSKTTVQYWLDPRAEERCPPAEFVRFLDKRIAERSLVFGVSRCA